MPEVLVFVENKDTVDDLDLVGQRAGKSVSVSQQVFFAVAKALYSEEELLEMVAEYDLDLLDNEVVF